MRFPFALRRTVDRPKEENSALRGRVAFLEQENSTSDEALDRKNDAIGTLLRAVHGVAHERIQRDMPGIANGNPACANCDVFKQYRRLGL